MHESRHSVRRLVLYVWRRETQARLLVALLGFLLAGCQARPPMCGGVIYVERTPLVTLESVTETADSPGRGFPLLAYPLPLFPLEMKRAGIAGEVVVRLTVSSEGEVERGIVVRSSQREFEAAALVAAQKWRFVEFVYPWAPKRTGMTVDCEIRFGFEKD